MTGMNGIGTTDVKTAQSVTGSANVTKDAAYGKTIGEPKLSDEAKKYYDSLKKKFGNYDFILVSKDEKENAKANAAKYANAFKTVVLIDDEKIEKMASDPAFRKKYEDLLSGASAKLSQLKSSMEGSSSSVKGYGFTVNDNGTLSYFAVLKKSSAEQKARIEKNAEAKREAKKAEEKRARKEEEKERIKSRGSDDEDDFWSDDADIITADSIEELLKKIEQYDFDNRSNSIQSESEKYLGQSIDFRG